jgi:predicted nuclease of predicted toxin-antitoxin system
LAANGRADVIHARDLPDGKRTQDVTLNEISLREQRILVAKDEDFVNTFLLRRQPYKLLLIATGNITNRDLAQLFQDNLELMIQAFEKYDFVELDRTALICHL